MKDELISIIVPVYGVEEYLDRCIESIMQQTYTNFELILVDDGSKDNCPQMCDRWREADSRIKVIHKSNGGLSDARNAGYRNALGKYIVFIDSDDWISPYYLELLYCSMIDNQCDIVECGYESVSEMVPFNTVEHNMNKCKTYLPEEALRLLIDDHEFRQVVWNKIYKKSVIQQILFEVGKLNEDEFWTYQVFGNVQTLIGKINIPLYFYFQRPLSIMGNAYSVRRLDAIEAKIQRQRYLVNRYPELADEALINLWTTTIYHGQMSLTNLQKEDLKTAKNKINYFLSEIPKSNVLQNHEYRMTEKVWIILAEKNFWLLCRLKNFLHKGLD